MQEEVKEIMKANYHTHTWRCKHTQPGTEEEYVQKAIEYGLSVLGFSDHTPYPMEPGYCSGFRMFMDQTRDYVDTVLDLREKYKDQIQILLGFETEYYPKYFPGYLEYIKDLPLDYILLGQHYSYNELEPQAFHVSVPSADGEAFIQYVEQTCEGMRTGVFSSVNHPDIYNFKGSPEVFRTECEKLCRCAKEMDLPLEINGLGIRDHRNYPDLVFWEIAGQVGNDCIFGCDAHSPKDVWDQPSYEETLRMADRYHLNLLDTLKLHHPCR